MICVIGRGQVGQALVKAMPYCQNPDLQISENPSQMIEAAIGGASTVILAAANTDVDWCEENLISWATNFHAAIRIYDLCRKIGAKFVFYSSDYVFDGEKGNYEPSDLATPINEYGRQKQEVEYRMAPSSALVIRTASVVSDYTQNNFKSRVLNRLATGQPIMAPDDIVCSFTDADDLAKRTIASLDATGVHHIAGPEKMTRYEFARRTVEKAGGDPSLVIPCKAAQLRRIAPRPKNSTLVSTL